MAAPKKEVRTTAAEHLDLRVEEGNTRTVSGYAAVFDKPSEPLGFAGRIIERIKRGAFAKSLQQRDVLAFWNHNMDIVLGRMSAGNLKLSEDDHGLRFELKLLETQAGSDALENIRSGVVKGMSFGFETVSDEWERGEGGQPHKRLLTEVNLFEVSPTPFPAYPQTNVSARSTIEEIVKEHEERWMYEDKEKQEHAGIPTTEFWNRFNRADWQNPLVMSCYGRNRR